MPEKNTNPLPPEVQQMLAEQLRDVHLPEAISWWPLAWGWWLILGLILLIVTTSVFFFYKKRQKNRYRGLAITSLEIAYSNWSDNQNNQAYLHQANDILKRCVLHVSKSAPLATQTGQTWVAELNNWGKKALSEKTQNALGFECYQAAPSSDIKALHTELMYWLKTHEYRLENITKTKRGLHA